MKIAWKFHGLDHNEKLNDQFSSYSLCVDDCCWEIPMVMQGNGLPRLSDGPWTSFPSPTPVRRFQLPCPAPLISDAVYLCYVHRFLERIHKLRSHADCSVFSAFQPRADGIPDAQFAFVLTPTLRALTKHLPLVRIGICKHVFGSRKLNINAIECARKIESRKVAVGKFSAKRPLCYSMLHDSD